MKEKIAGKAFVALEILGGVLGAVAGVALVIVLLHAALLAAREWRGLLVFHLAGAVIRSRRRVSVFGRIGLAVLYLGCGLRFDRPPSGG